MLVGSWVTASSASATTCANICPGVPSTCVVAATIDVTPGSVLDCGTSNVQVTGGNLRVTNGFFTLKAASVSISNGRKIESLCTGSTRRHGYRIETTGNVTTSGNGGFKSTCTNGGGRVTIVAGGTVTLGGTGIDAGGTSVNGRGGFIRIDAGGAVTTTANLKAGAATTSGLGVTGGGIDIDAASISIGADLTVSGYILAGGQAIRLRADQDITITSGIVNASTANGDGGEVVMDAGGTIDIRRPVKANGQGTLADGGTVDLTADAVKITRDVLSHGGNRGGTITIEAQKKIDIGTGATQAFEIEADRSSNNPGSAGEILITSRGHDVLFGQFANVHASALQGGDGGAIEITGVAVTAAAGSQIVADGSAGSGGTISIEGRGPITLSGTMHATNGEAVFTYLSPAPVVGSGVTGTWSTVLDEDLDAPCGDGITRDPAEQCDDPDLGSATCCTDTCTVCP